MGRTELKGIADTAKVLVEISDNTFQTSSMDEFSPPKNLNNVTSIVAGKMNLSPRESKQKLAPQESMQK